MCTRKILKKAAAAAIFNISNKQQSLKCSGGNEEDWKVVASM
jgi:hypothetical protein